MNNKPKLTSQNKKTARRLLSYVTGVYKVQFIIVVISILICAAASISVSLSMKFLLDDFIVRSLVRQIRIILSFTERFWYLL